MNLNEQLQQAYNAGRRQGLNEQGIGRRLLGDILDQNVGSRKRVGPFRFPQSPRLPEPGPNMIHSLPFDPSAAMDDVLDALQSQADMFFRTLLRNLPVLGELYPVDFDAFRALIRSIRSSPEPATANDAAEMIEILTQMDIAISWDLEAGRIFFHHDNPDIQSTLYLVEGYLGITDGMLENMLRLLEGGYNP
tara:strand:+ start:405 stop:980 length:576 start_codon:yes stop_codon:yes gene_type:complete